MRPLHKFWHVPFVWLKHLIKGPAILSLGLLLSSLGIIFATLGNGSFWVIALGIPLLTGGISFVIYGLYDLIFGFFSSRHQLIDCPFCHNLLKFKLKEDKIICKNCGNEIKS